MEIPMHLYCKLWRLGSIQVFNTLVVFLTLWCSDLVEDEMCRTPPYSERALLFLNGLRPVVELYNNKNVFNRCVSADYDNDLKRHKGINHLICNKFH